MRYLVLFSLLGLSALFTGCLSSGGSVVYTLYGGEKLTVPLSRTGLQPPSDDAIQIIMADFKPVREEKRLDYFFFFGMKKPGVVKSVRIEDYTDEDAPPTLLLEDNAPALKNGVWSNTTTYVAGADARLKWVYYEVQTPCIYRFTITLEDGSKHVLTHVVVFPSYLKPRLRDMLGLSSKP